MARPKPIIIAEHTDKVTYRTNQVVESDGVYSVFYDGKPINLKTFNKLIAYPGPRYHKTSFSNSGHAVSLAKKLNEQFMTDKFRVVRLTQGEFVF